LVEHRTSTDDIPVEFVLGWQAESGMAAIANKQSRFFAGGYLPYKWIAGG
jgi:hypothetical protein